MIKSTMGNFMAKRNATDRHLAKPAVLSRNAAPVIVAKTAKKKGK